MTMTRTTALAAASLFCPGRHPPSVESPAGCSAWETPP